MMKSTLAALLLALATSAGAATDAASFTCSTGTPPGPSPRPQRRPPDGGRPGHPTAPTASRTCTPRRHSPANPQLPHRHRGGGAAHRRHRAGDQQDRREERAPRLRRRRARSPSPTPSTPTGGRRRAPISSTARAACRPARRDRRGGLQGGAGAGGKRQRERARSTSAPLRSSVGRGEHRLAAGVATDDHVGAACPGGAPPPHNARRRSRWWRAGCGHRAFQAAVEDQVGEQHARRQHRQASCQNSCVTRWPGSTCGC